MSWLKRIFHLAAFTGLGGLGFLLNEGAALSGQQTRAVGFQPEDVPLLVIDSTLQDSSYVRGRRKHDVRFSDWRARQQQIMEVKAQREKFEAWCSQFDSLKGAALEDKLKHVNDAVNKGIAFNYDIDGEYWAAPIESILSGRGDCEDYAIAKFYLLEYLDVPNSRYVFAGVGLTPNGTNHAVLLVDISDKNDGTDWVVLDNECRDIKRLSDTCYWPQCVIDMQGRVLTAKRTSVFVP